MAGTSSNIPTEIRSDEGIVSTEASLASAASSPVTSAAISAIQSPTSASVAGKCHISHSAQTKRKLFMYAEPDIEDYGNLLSTGKKSRADDTLLHTFRNRRGLSVTDVTHTEWCDMKMEFSLYFNESKNSESKPRENQKQIDLDPFYERGRRGNEAIKAGVDRHVQLRQEVLSPVKVKVKSLEDDMAVKLVNFINGVNQLLSEELTRELPIVSFAFAQGIWMVGKIDEVRMPKEESGHKPILVETKTRFHDTVPSEPQKRNGRIQLMCYKYLWDNLVAHANHDFPSKQLFDYFELNPQHALSEDLRAVCADFEISALTLEDVVMCYQNTCKKLSPAHDQLVLKYESQKDRSVLDEEKVKYNEGWIKSQIQNCLEFWLGQREASYVAEEEQWKCGFCNFRSECPAYTDTESESGEYFSFDSSSE
ncbi:exonuclease V, chloroplastic [Cajanus cajan]|uniref:exonuclease V, chloroplastic n=1 Tax=Cajanus cajan TaxID=3821 RepID=UPI00098DCCB8|nr:exonuclease V, chloroplastic [Cajanus cajan]